MANWLEIDLDYVETDIDGQIYIPFKSNERDDEHELTFKEAFAKASKFAENLLSIDYAVLMYLEEYAVIVEYATNANDSIKFGSGTFVCLDKETYNEIQQAKLNINNKKEEEE